MLEAENAKYGTAYGMDMVDPASNSVFALAPEWAFALDSSDFTGSPTRFTFSPETARTGDLHGHAGYPARSVTDRALVLTPRGESID